MSSRILCNCGPRKPADQPRRVKFFVRDEKTGLLAPVCSGCRKDRPWKGYPPIAAKNVVRLRDGYGEYVAQLVMTE